MKTSLAIKLYYLHRFFAHFIFFWAIDKIFFAQHGASPFTISLLVSLWTVHEMVLEVPSGIIADKWSRKWLLVISSIFHAASYFVWIFSYNFWTFLLGYIFMGTGGVLVSGTADAFLYDHLKVEGKEGDFEKHTGEIWFLTTVSFLIAALFAGTLAERFSFTLVLVLSIFSSIISGTFAVLMPDAPRSKSTEEVSYWKFLTKALKKSLKHPILLRALIYSSVVLAAYGELDEYDQLYVKFIGLPLSLFGIWWFIRMMGEGFGSLVAHKLKKVNIEKALAFIALTNGCILIFSGLTSNYLTLPLLGLMYGLFAIAAILNNGVIQRQIGSHERATVTSINSLFVSITAIIGGLAFGFISSKINPGAGFIFFGMFILAYFAIKLIAVRLVKAH